MAPPAPPGLICLPQIKRALRPGARGGKHALREGEVAHNAHAHYANVHRALAHNGVADAGAGVMRRTHGDRAVAPAAVGEADVSRGTLHEN